MVRQLADSDAAWLPHIGGVADPSHQRAVLSVVAPYDGHELGRVEQSDSEDVALAVAVASAAWRDHLGPGHVRALWLRLAADALEAETEAIVTTLIRTLGKPRRLSEGEARRGPAMLRNCAEEISRMRGETLPLDAVPGGEGRWGFTRREPFGVVAAITPFNAPVNLLLQKVAPALAMGNAVIVKPAPEGAIVTLQLAEILADAVPPGLLAVLPGGPDIALELVARSEVRAVSLTGGVDAGRSVMSQAGIKPVLLELGSNAPNIVCADADLEKAATGIAGAAFAASGQQCISAQRVIVERPAAEAFAELFAAAAATMVVGDPNESTTDIGPVINQRARTRIVEHVDDAVARGADLVLDGRRDDLCLGPTILSQVPRDARVMREEVFGPVVALITADSVDHAIALANDSDLGLQASCFTGSLATAMRAAEDLQAGSVWINEPTRFRLDIYPFGGYRNSGIGREGVRYTMEALSQLKFVGITP